MSERNPFIDFVERYYDDPVAFCREVVGVEPDDWQITLLNAIARGERHIAVRSGHGVGKSFILAVAMLWYFLTRFPVKIVVTAPTAPQLFDALFAEVKGRVRQLPPVVQQLLEAQKERIELKGAPEEAFISARTSRAEAPEALQGIHAENVMLIIDEASGVPEAVFEAGGGSMSGENAVTIMAGNPTRVSGLFFRAFHTNRDKWFGIKVSCLDSPRVSAAYVQGVIDEYGEDSNQYRIRVLGEFPLSDEDTLIPRDLVEAAMDRDVMTSPTAPVTWGVDVARFGSDRSVLAKRKGETLISYKAWRNLDLMQLTGAIKAEWDATADKQKPLDIFVDSIGIGSGVVDRLRELGLPVRGINVSESPAMGQIHTNLRSELWSKGKRWLEQRNCKLPKDDQLLDELTTVRFSYASNGKLVIESKDAMRKRGLASPDIADAVLLTLAGDAAIGLYGRSGAKSGKPLRRSLKGIC